MVIYGYLLLVRVKVGVRVRLFRRKGQNRDFR